jgi:predicted transcriptional regulator
MDEETLKVGLRLEPEHYACLAVYGNALRNGFQNAEYTEQHIDNFVGREVSRNLESLERLGYLEKHIWEDGKRDYLYEIADDEEVRQDTENIMKHVDKEYGGRIYEFIENFDVTDRKKLLEDEVRIVKQNQFHSGDLNSGD